MNFFDSIIEEAKECLAPFEKKTYPVDKIGRWQRLDHSEVIMMRDTAYELDGSGFNLVTSNEIGESEIVVIGKNLGEITSDCAFARISLLQLDDVDDEQKAYNLIRKVEYAKYHFFPKGFMMRSSSHSQKENVRVSKAELKSGLSFEKAGRLLYDEYMKNSAVKAVKIIFVTDGGVDFKRLEALSRKNYEVTKALNHVMNSVNFDCDTCNLKPICDEVEGMKELHFKNAEMGAH